MHSDSREQAEDIKQKAEAFIDKVVASVRQRQRTDPESERARADLNREVLELAKRALAESGIDVAGLDRLAEERSGRRKELAEESRKRSVDASALAARRLSDLLVHIPPIEPLETVIDQMTFIRSFLGQGLVSDSNIGPMDNWAKYSLSESADAITENGVGRLSFFALWQNDRNSPTTIMVRPNLIVNGHLSCDADGGGVAAWFFPNSMARASVRARTTVWSMDSTVSSIVHEEELAGTAAHGGFFGDDASTSVEFNGFLAASGVTIPAQAYSLIEVELVTEWAVRSATVVFDAKDGDRMVAVPQIVLTQLQTEEPPQPAPISVTPGVDYNTSPATVTLIFTGANGAMVDIYENNVRLGDTDNDGTWSRQYGPGTYLFRVCERLSSVCSTEVSVTVTQ